MECDFGSVNLQYLLQARQIARTDPELAELVLSVPNAMVRMIADLDDACFAHVSKIKSPLVVTRGDLWWWSRLRLAVEDGNSDEIQAVVAHADLALLDKPSRGD